MARSVLFEMVLLLAFLLQLTFQWIAFNVCYCKPGVHNGVRGQSGCQVSLPSSFLFLNGVGKFAAFLPVLLLRDAFPVCWAGRLGGPPVFFCEIDILCYPEQFLKFPNLPCGPKRLRMPVVSHLQEPWWKVGVEILSSRI